jgi:hypothetical protein
MPPSRRYLTAGAVDSRQYSDGTEPENMRAAMATIAVPADRTDSAFRAH